MNIISFVFFAFFAATYISLYICNKVIKDDVEKINKSNWILLLASYLFVIYADYRFAIVLFVISVSTWFFAKKRKGTAVGILIPLVALGFFKYTNFFAESFASLFGQDYTMLNIILPIGISFYSFSAISYLVDVKRGKLKPKSFKDVALYLAYFPKITSGPIQRGTDFFKIIETKRTVGWQSFSVGIQIFVFGLFKKIVLADRLSVFVNQVYDTPLAFGSLTVFLATIAYSFQIYFDFSGYSDMAIGISKALGIDLPKNFNIPYVAHNVTELWKRWHISLSSWLQEYLYISLGGNRKGKIRTYVNLILTMVIGGIWHGANWTYIIWGMLHGFALAVHKLWMRITGSANKVHSFLSDSLSIVVTFLFTTLCWVFFRAESFEHAITIIKRILEFESGLEQIYIWLVYSVIILFGATVFAFVKSRQKFASVYKNNMSSIAGFYPVLNLSKFWSMVIFFVFCGLIICLAYTGGSPFIYGKY